MAKRPRWIRHLGVGSAAMLGAYLPWVQQAPPEAQRQVEHLYAIDHAG